MVGYTKTGAPKANGLQLRPRPPSSPTSLILGGSMSGSAKAAHTQQLQLQPPKQEGRGTFTILLLKCTL